MATAPSGLNAVVRENLDRHIDSIENALDRDAVAVYGPIITGLDTMVRDSIEDIQDRRTNRRAVVILDTNGGSAEVVERMVETIRTFYDDVAFIIPDRAMSAGTIFALSGDSIYMDYYARLGPIDPQVIKDDRFVPALSYLIQYERLIKKGRDDALTDAEYVLLSKFDLAELHQFELARELSITLLKNWLAKYKFKNWLKTETHGSAVTLEKREERAKAIATVLSDNQRWHSHNRGISRFTLEGDEIKLKIDDLAADKVVHGCVRRYHHCLSDYMRTVRSMVFVHTRGYYESEVL